MDAATEESRARASSLRRDAARLLQGAGLLDEIRGAVGPVEVVGSVDLDLMVWPDVDLYARLAPDQGWRLVALMPALYQRLGRQGHAIVRATFNDEYRRPGSPYGRGLYAGFVILPAGGAQAWKVDLWGWDEATLGEKMAEHRALARALAGADRDLILRIKDAVHRRPEYRDTLTSMDVYAFAIQRAGRSVADFDEFVARRKGGMTG
jgi:hypothetical protein